MDLLEREAPLQRLGELVKQAREGEGRIALIRGEAGIGKTSVVRALTQTVADQAHVLWGSCDDLLAPRPLGPIVDMSFEEPRLVDALTANGANNVLSAMMELFNRALRPTVAVFEDVHWADGATLDLLTSLGRRVERTHTLLVMTFREKIPAGHQLGVVLGDLPKDFVENIELEPLSHEAVHRLAGMSAEHSQDRPGAWPDAAEVDVDPVDCDYEGAQAADRDLGYRRGVVGYDRRCVDSGTRHETAMADPALLCKSIGEAAGVLARGWLPRPRNVDERGGGSLIGCNGSLANRTSRWVRMPTRRPVRSSTTGMPEIDSDCITASASDKGWSGRIVIGFTTMPDSNRLTLRTSSACSLGSRFLWMTPMPPAWARVIAISASVTVSIAADSNGILSVISLVSRVDRSTSRGKTSE